MIGEPAARKGSGTVTVKTEFCQGCGYCRAFCPTQALDESPAANSQGHHPPVLARPEACTGCDLCGMYCPDFAIHGRTWKEIDDHCASA